jgi:hypothetical protein
MSYAQLLSISLSLNVFQALVIAFSIVVNCLMLFKPRTVLKLLRKVTPQ